MNVSPQIQGIMDRFMAELAQALQQEATNAVQNAFGGAAPTAVKRGPRQASNGKGTLRQEAREPGQPRDPAELEGHTKQLLAYIRKHPGQRIEQIGAELGISTKLLATPVKTLLREKSIGKKGVKRATTYTAK